VQAPAAIDFENTQVIFTGPYPSSFLAPYLPPSATFSFTQTQPWADGAEHELKNMVRNRLDASEGPFVAVILDIGSKEGIDSLPVIFRDLHDDLGLDASRDTCAAFVTSVDSGPEHWIACPLEKAG
jgi:hypothetical protein